MPDKMTCFLDAWSDFLLWMKPCTTFEEHDAWRDRLITLIVAETKWSKSTIVPDGWPLWLWDDQVLPVTFTDRIIWHWSVFLVKWLEEVDDLLMMVVPSHETTLFLGEHDFAFRMSGTSLRVWSSRCFANDACRLWADAACCWAAIFNENEAEAAGDVVTAESFQSNWLLSDESSDLLETAAEKFDGSL